MGTSRKILPVVAALLLSLWVFAGLGEAHAAKSDIEWALERSGDELVLALKANKDMDFGEVSFSYTYTGPSTTYVGEDSILEITHEESGMIFLRGDSEYIMAGENVAEFVFSIDGGFDKSETYSFSVMLGGGVNSDGKQYDWAADGTEYSVSYFEDEVEYPVEGGSLYFKKSTGSVTGCDKTVTAAAIPDAIEGAAVTAIADYAFSWCTELESVTIPAGVKSIGGEAFYNCKSKASITLPSINKIRDHTFWGCSSLSEITIPAAVKNIGEEAFSGCSALESITVPKGV